MNSKRIALSFAFSAILSASLVVYAVPAMGQSHATQDTAKAAKPRAVPTIDAGLVGVWGVDAQGGYEFKADGTFIMQGTMTYKFDAAKGVWHYWQPATPGFKIAAEYKLSADGKSLSINLKTGKPFTNLKRIK